ncbi:MAG: N-acetylmuramidase domain-containing protein [Pseudomonadota bacterium]
MARFSNETKDEIVQVAQARGIEPAALLAVCEVESGGRAFAIVEHRREPLIRFEGHYFDRLLSGVAREKARTLGLASPRAGAVKNPRSQAGRWALLDRARSIDDAAALQSCSWGIGQVMGAHWKTLGFSSPQALVREARSGVSGQVTLMVRFVERNELLPFLKNRDWAGFARRYNGPAYRKNRYDEKMAAAYARYRVPDGGAVPVPSQSILRRGMRGAEVKDWQRQLLAVGYPLSCDGVFGPKTEVAVKRFQRANAISVDGIVGPETRKAMSLRLTSPEKSAGWISSVVQGLLELLPLLRLNERLRR